MAQTTPQDLAEQALAVPTSEQCIVIVHDTHAANLRWANNTLTTNGVMHGMQVSVIALDGPRSASVSGSAWNPDQVADLVGAADAAVRDASPAEDVAPLVEGAAAEDWTDAPGETGIAVFERFATELGQAFESAEAQRRILYGFVSHDVTTTYLASSTGLRLRHEQPTGHYGCTGKPADLSASAWVGGATRDFGDVSALDMFDRLTTRLGWAGRSVDLPAGRYDTVLPPTAVADLMIDAYWGAGARVAHEGQSVYSRPGGGTRIGELMVDEHVRLYSDPSYAGLQAAPFVVDATSSNTSSVYDNGLPLSKTDWIADGRLAALLQTRHTAAMTGQPITPAIDNLVLEIAGATDDESELVAGVDDGLLLTCLWYIREVDPQTMLLTGLTRDGVYRVEGGEVTGVVNNFRFNESPVDLLRRFTAASTTVPSFSREWGDDYFSRTATPALRVPDFNMSSVSQAL
ncbi:metallopeptidase TldD-related protein [Nocardioides terrisoli]|uniref:metallopeptidase TldD-related protein n=1 Tax=Nocardioides terrisoli TaxID=3388267 RepID=UPI00287B6E44|nr:metallopeptidase TldD-related protein [Nocardioides marmorisolisilvae]